MPAGPLYSWDIFIEEYHRLLANGRDIQQLQKLARKNNWCSNWNMEDILVRQGKVILVTTPLLTIFFASSTIEQLTGYSVNEVLGNTPKLFQGKDTSNEARTTMRTAVDARLPFHVSLLNYTKNGCPYRCEIEAWPVFNKQQQLVNFIAFESVPL